MDSKSLILVAGGDAADRETILQALNDEFHVVAAQTIEDALAHAKDSVGLVICDLESTQVHGMELVRLWKARQPHTPFIALTNGSDVGSAIEAMKNGVADCLVKPLDQDDLRSTAMQLVNQTWRRSINGQRRRLDEDPHGSRTLIFRRELRWKTWSGRPSNRRSCSTMEIARMQPRRWESPFGRCSES